MTRERILFLSANPSSTSRLALDEEVRAIQVRLRQSGAAERIELCTEWALRGEDLPAALMRHRPRIVHFSGHGSSAGELFLSAGDSSDIRPITAETLRHIFEPLTGAISCVVLNACYSAVQAKTLAEILPCVVGMTKAVKDKAAIAFAAGFYETLAFGESIQTAFKLGCTQIELAQESGQSDIPKMLLRPGTDAAQLRPFAPAAFGPTVKGASRASSALPSSPAWIWVVAAMVLTLLFGGVYVRLGLKYSTDPMPDLPPPVVSPPSHVAEGVTSKPPPVVSGSAAKPESRPEPRSLPVARGMLVVRSELSARITVGNFKKQTTARSGDQASARFENLPVGDYRVTCEFSGLPPKSISLVKVHTGENLVDCYP